MNAATTTAQPTTISLNASYYSASYKAPDTFVAVVQFPATGVFVTSGQVILCNANAVRCAPEFALATAQIDIHALATFHLTLGAIGNHSYKAVFLGTQTALPSTSATLTTPVTGTYADTTTLTASGNPGAYSLTATTTGLATTAPTGLVSFNDTTANTSLGTAALGTPTSTFGQVQAGGSPITVGYEYDGATADLNGDGFPDIVGVSASANGSLGRVDVLLGKGDGTFNPVLQTAVNIAATRISVGDLNDDGVPDLVVTGNGNAILVLIGNGDGTYKPGVSYAGAGSTNPSSGFEEARITDLNHDGFADIVAVDSSTATASIFLGNGDGTFQQGSALTASQASGPLTVGDFNQDGFTDLAVLGNEGVTIFLGAGDGTFTTRATYVAGSQDGDVKVGDFNGDGVDDLAVGNLTANTVDVLIGTGDGTFASKVSYTVGGAPKRISIADFNQDGRQDIASAGFTATAQPTLSYLLGNGDGTFAPQLSSSANYPVNIPAADFNGDGLPDLAMLTDQSSTTSVTVYLSQITQTTTATLNNIAIAAPTGTHQITASYPGDTNFAASTSTAIPLINSTLPATSTALTIAPAPQTVGSPVTFTVRIAAPNSPTAIPTGTVTLTYTGTTSGTLATGTLTAGVATLTSSALPVGAYSITAIYSGSTAFAPSTSTAQPLTITASTSITNLAISAANLTVGQTETLTATIVGISGLPPTGTVTFFDGTTSLGSSPITTNAAASTATLALTTLTAGTHPITARYLGDANYLTSASPIQTVTVGFQTTTTTLQATPATLALGATETLTAVITGGTIPPQTGSVTFFDGTTTLGTVNVTANATGSTATFTTKTLSIGTHQITARYSGDTTYATSVSTAQTVTVTNSATTVTLTPSAAAITAIQSETLTATILGGSTPVETGTVTFADQTGTLGAANVTPTTTGSVATLTLPTLSVLTHQITARYSGDTNYAAATTSLAVPVVVSLAPQTITFPAIPDHHVFDSAFTLMATSTSNLPVTFSVVSGPATLSGASVTVTGPGTVVLQATQTGNASYAAATPRHPKL